VFEPYSDAVLPPGPLAAKTTDACSP
jgi:hypothetical protein